MAVLLVTVQFEGSLGKLTVSSVNNPRKMIDAVVTTRTDDDPELLLALMIASMTEHGWGCSLQEQRGSEIGAFHFSDPLPFSLSQYLPLLQETKEKQVRDKRRQTLFTIER
eukprot:g25518.t1